MQLSNEQKEQYTFMLGIANICLTCWMMGAYPQYFYLLFTVKSIYLITRRFFYFKSNGEHYYLFDMCYWINLLYLVQIWFFPDNMQLFRLVFFMANGPLALAAVALRNSLIFHSREHLTSVFIHLSPMMATYCDRWTNYRTVFHDSILQSMVESLVFYLAWAIGYYLYVLIAKDGHIKEKQYKTLYTYNLEKVKQLKPLKEAQIPEWKKKIYYMLFHAKYTLIGVLIGSITWLDYRIHFLYMFAIGLRVAWNASTYYLPKIRENQTNKPTTTPILHPERIPAFPRLTNEET